MEKKRPIQAVLMTSDNYQWETILSEKKQMTIREGLRDYAPGKLMIVNPETSRCVRVEITSVDFYKAKYIPERDCLDDGFTGLEDMLSGMKKYYPKFSPDSDVTVIKWKNVSGLLVDNYREAKRQQDLGEQSR